jgi:hypothetical protein
MMTVPISKQAGHEDPGRAQGLLPARAMQPQEFTVGL